MGHWREIQFRFWCHRAQNQTLEYVVVQTNQTNKAAFYLAIWFPGAARGASLSAPNKLKAKPHIPAGLVQQVVSQQLHEEQNHKQGLSIKWTTQRPL